MHVFRLPRNKSMSQPENDSWKVNKVLQIHAADNVGVALATLYTGDTITVGNTQIRVIDRVHYGHKVSLRPIRCGTDVVKYGVPIGEATADIAPGSHVHSHNLKSKYLDQFSSIEGT